MKLYLALFLIKSIGQREQHQQVLCTGRTFSSTHLVDFTSAFWRGRRWDGTFIFKWNMNFITMNPRIMTSTHLMVPHHVWIKRASLGSKKQKQYDQFEPHTKSQPIHKFSLSLAWFQKQYQCEIYITICIRCGAKNEVRCVSLVGSIEMKKLASGWCHVRWGPIDDRPNWIINIYIFLSVECLSKNGTRLTTALEILGNEMGVSALEQCYMRKKIGNIIYTSWCDKFVLVLIYANNWYYFFTYYL